MAAGKYDFTIEQSATFKAVITWTDDTEAPIDITGYTVKMQIRPRIGSPTILYTLDSTALDNTIVLSDPSNGEITLTINKDDTATFTWEVGVYDLKFVSPDLVATRLLEGQARVSPEVTPND